jgi:hypothetical protein
MHSVLVDAVIFDYIDRLRSKAEKKITSRSIDSDRIFSARLPQLDAALAFELAPIHITKALDRLRLDDANAE